MAIGVPYEARPQLVRGAPDVGADSKTPMRFDLMLA
jgi:hypothetical protein